MVNIHHAKKNSARPLGILLLLIASLVLTPLGVPSGVTPAAAQADVPTLLEPLDGSFPPFTPTFRWTPVPGVDKYRLEWTTDPTCNFGAGSTSFVETKNPIYTPTTSFPNDVNYCWRVQTRTGATASPWSPTWTFIKRWYIQPLLLTPTNGHQYVRDAFFSWTPVPGAARYKIEVSPENSFPPKHPGWTEYTANPFFNQPDKALGGVWYWRVTPVDYNRNEGKPSIVYSFRGVHPDAARYPAPQLAYPLYYFEPRADVQPHEDRTAALPLFGWKRTLTGVEQAQAAAYRIQVDDDGGFRSIDWMLDTHGLAAAPTAGHPFEPQPNKTYYWRVCALDVVGGSCLQDPDNGLPMWSEVWRTRFDSELALPAQAGAAPVPLRPEEGYEAVEAAPLFEWWPLPDAAQYEVEIAIAPDFSPDTLVQRATVPYPAYAPLEPLDYYPTEASDLPYGTFYWRVRGLDAGGASLGGWSTPWRFQVAAQSHWQYGRPAGSLANRWPLAFDLDDTAVDGYELVDLNVSQSSGYWHFGFHATPLDASRAYGLYLDLDQDENVGAPGDPRGNQVFTLPAHRPDYALYVQEGPAPFPFTPDNVLVYAYDGTNWSAPQSLLAWGGDIFPSQLTAIGAIPGTQFTMGKYGAILQGNGSEWTLLPSPTANTLHDLVLREDWGERWAVGDFGTVLFWNYSANAWRMATPGTSNHLYALDIAGPKYVWVAGAKGVVRYWNGMYWLPDQFENTSFNLDIYGLDLLDGGSDGWAVGQGGTILRRAASGFVMKWQEIPSPTANNLRDVVTLSSDEGWAVGDNGTILKRTGTAWVQVPSGTTKDLKSIAMTSASNGWAVGLNGTILHWDGAAWTSYASPTGHSLYSVRMLSETDGWIVGDNGVNMHWDGAAWTPVQDPIANYLELMVPNTAIGMGPETGSAALSLFSVDESTGLVQDTVPGGSHDILDRFASVSERLMLAAPPSNSTGDPTTYPTMLPLFWHWPTVVPWEGYRLEVALDPFFTTPVYTEDVTAYDNASPYLANAVHAPFYDFNGDNTYYWRVRPQYWQKGVDLGGAWSQPWRLERNGFLPPDLLMTFSEESFTFSWGRVDGAAAYELEVDNDPNFGQPEIRTTLTTQTSFTPITVLPDGKYYMRVRAVRTDRNGSVQIKGDWSVSEFVVDVTNQVYVPLVLKK